MTEPQPTTPPAPPPTPNPAQARAPDERARMVAQTLLGLLFLVLLIGTLHHFLQTPIERFGRAFVAHFGISGIFLGTFLSDGLHIPPPPQFYMLTLVSSRGPQLPTLVAIMAGSVCAAPVSYNLARLLARVPFFDRRFKSAAPRVERLMARYGFGAVIFGAISPIPYPLLCNLAGIYKIPWRYVSVMVALRPLRLLIMYWLIRTGWS